MSQEDPFESSNSDKTVMIPTPGGRTASPKRNANEQQSSINLKSFSESESAPPTGLNALIAAANPIFNHIPHLRTLQQITNLAELHEFLAQQIKTFENRAKASGYDTDKVIPARYALCTLLDETIASTPWGSGVWSKHSLLVKFHNEVSGGEKFFLLLAKLSENPGKNIELLEFMNICLSFGFEGRYRVMERGKSQLESLRERLVQLIRKERGEYEKELSSHWEATIPKQRKLFNIVPLWVLSALCGVILLAIYLGFNYSLNKVSDPVFKQIQSIQVKTPVPEPQVELPPPPSPARPGLRELLFKEIEAGLLTIRNENGRNIITLTGDNIFDSGSATVSQSIFPVLSNIATALNAVPGNIKITGHTDNRPMRSLRFPSNWHLSEERANSVLTLLTQMGVNSTRLSAEGHADAHPIASNNTAEGRARNRRVEINLISTPTY